MKILINGKEVILEKEITVAEMLHAQNVEMQEYVTVQINDEIIDREDFETLTVRENDIVEFLYFMGGGAL
ncbi:sulfur carrier protein ThiS [Candidatus Formimonas warabiya]|uniref:Thiamine biosynthesis protein ThiS n=1 Tax=Formimonas warabiya TaxID=1761012 RepID=A0A3G1KZW8_FORW1|nr:sulfur carrier protein ThiS [Candidatus Formimonas warabiya]ATW28072.1 thiamine biosynthesis protein ThiS [Candidatus Formimonas warabiya]